MGGGQTFGLVGRERVEAGCGLEFRKVEKIVKLEITL